MAAQDVWNSACRRPWILGVLIRVRARVKLGLSRGIQGHLVGKTAGPLGVLQALFYLKLYQNTKITVTIQGGCSESKSHCLPCLSTRTQAPVLRCAISRSGLYSSTVSPSDQITVQRGS